jgi:hypothetical protein
MTSQASPARALLPQGTDSERSFRLDDVVGLQSDHEKMGTAHSRRHGETSRQFGFLAGHQGRRTDDRLGRSTAFNDLDGRRRGQSERLIPHVLQTKARLDELVVTHGAEVDQLLIYRQSRPAAMRRRLTGRTNPRDRRPERRPGREDQTDDALNPEPPPWIELSIASPASSHSSLHAHRFNDPKRCTYLNR